MVLKTAAWHISRIRRRQFVRREEEEGEEGEEEEAEELIIVVRPPGPGCRCASTVQYTTYSTVHVCVCTVVMVSAGWTMDGSYFLQ